MNSSLTPFDVVNRVVTCVSTILFVSVLGNAHALAQTVSIDEVIVGLNNHFRVGHITQVRLSISSDQSIPAARIELRLPDGEGGESITSTDGVPIEVGQNRIDMLVKFGRVNSSLDVRVLDTSGNELGTKSISAVDAPDALRASQNLIATLGSDIGVDSAIATRREKDGQETIHCHVTDTSSLPSHWLGYGGVSLIILPGNASGLIQQMSADQIEALQRWVQMGGRLILSAGASATRTLAIDGTFQALAPGRFVRIQMQRQTSGLESYAGKTAQSLDSFVLEGELAFRLPIAVLEDTSGSVVVSEGLGDERTATIIRSSHGFGHVTFVAADLDQPPISRWKDGRKKILVKLIDAALGATERDENENPSAQFSQIGFGDITGQLRSALDQFPGVRLVPFSWIALLIALYLLLIGPLDYLLLHRWQRRFALTWITFPLLVVIGCALAFCLTNYWKGNTLRINKVDIVDVDSETGLMRATTWAHLFSPIGNKYDLSIKTTNALLSVTQPGGSITSWQGLPGNSFGGMDTSRLSTADAYEIASQFRTESKQEMCIMKMPVDIYGSRCLSGLVWGQVSLPTAEPLSADLDSQVLGQVTNPLPVDLRDAMLCYGRWVYPLGTLPGKGTATIDRFSKFKTIDGMLTRTQVDQDFKDRSQAWDRRSLDVNRILEVMMFHRAAGGTKYTALLDRYQADIDFSDHLKQSRALLIGKTRQSPTKLLDEEQAKSQTETYVRILLPVTQRRTR